MDRVQANVTCYHCGHVSGRVIANDEGSLAAGEFFANGAATNPAPARGLRLRCGRCSGPIYLEEAEPFRERPPIVITWAGRGRPPKRPRPDIGIVVRDGPLRERHSA